jgi:aminopeptidase-like protein
VVGDYNSYTYLDRESDERQYCAPGVDLPVCTLARSKYNTYPEYHTSLDDLSVISPSGLESSFNLVTEIIHALEGNSVTKCQVLCEPQLGPRGLYPSLSTKQTRNKVRTMMNLIAYSDGSRDLLELADEIGEYVGDLFPLVNKLVDADVLSVRH